MGTWKVCDEYEVRNEEIVAKHAGFDPTDKTRRWRNYLPLEDTPDLFLKLAAMHKAPRFTESALVFSHKYGLLGGNSTQPVRIKGNTASYKTSLSSWWEEAERAWVILKLYEATLSYDEEVVRYLYNEYRNTVFKKLHCLWLGDESIVVRDWDIADTGFMEAGLMVQETVQLHCRPALDFPDEDPFKVVNFWEFDCLLGAMYLQMYWLITSGNDLGHCEHCGRTFFLARTHPEGRKRRADKRFCDNACRQAHHRSKKKG